MSITLKESISQLKTGVSPSCYSSISPMPKVTGVICFIVLAVSIGRYDWFEGMFFALIPFVLAGLGKLNVLALVRKSARALPFVLCAGFANCFFDRTPFSVLGVFEVTGGWVTLFVLILKTLATVGMMLLLSASTPFKDLSSALSRLGMPRIMVLQLQLTFRYLEIVAVEGRNSVIAYRLRNPDARLIPLGDWGGLVGHLFLRSLERANGVYRAMECRLFLAGGTLPRSREASFSEWCGCIVFVFALVVIRILA